MTTVHKGLSIRGGLRERVLIAAATGLDLEIAAIKATTQDPVAPKQKHVTSEIYSSLHLHLLSSSLHLFIFNLPLSA